jgi:hypothetical protein
MFILFNDNESGSPEIRLVEKALDMHWVLLKRNVSRILRAIMHDSSAANAFEERPFELWSGTNGFGDRFEVLHMKATVQVYLETELLADTYIGKKQFENIAQAMAQAGNPIRFISMDADVKGPDMIATPQLQSTSVAVLKALSDFEVLVRSQGGPTSGLDRIHTAFHGFLKSACAEACIAHPDDADMVSLFALIREKHPKFQKTVPGLERTTNILRGMSRIVDALNPVRNRHSMAHPTDELLEEPEALLTVNVVKTLLHYLEMKLR